jgi:hypothetical protein
MQTLGIKNIQISSDKQLKYVLKIVSCQIWFGRSSQNFRPTPQPYPSLVMVAAATLRAVLLKQLWVVKFLIIIINIRFDISPNISHDTKKWVVKFRGVKFPGSKIPNTVRGASINDSLPCERYMSLVRVIYNAGLLFILVICHW